VIPILASLKLTCGHRQTVRVVTSQFLCGQHAEDMRAEMSLILESLGIQLRYVHHGHGPDQGRWALSSAHWCNRPTEVLKYVVQNVANAYGKPRLPCPSYIVGEQRFQCRADPSGKTEPFLRRVMVTQVCSLPVLHRRHHQTCSCIERSQPGTNSYKRMGTETPVKLAYSAKKELALRRFVFPVASQGPPRCV
jgi:glutamine synthetase